MKQAFKINLVFLIGIFGAWATRAFGNIDGFYFVLAVLIFIPLNIILFFIKKK